MKRYDVVVFLNARPLAMADGYRDDDELRVSEVTLDVAGSTIEYAADEVWRLLNADDRPNARSERSLSVGDVVALSRGGETTYLAAAPVGWREVHPTTSATR